MRVALITDGLWPQVIGGIQKHSYNLCRYLASNGVFVDVYYTCVSENVEIDGFFTDEDKRFISFIYVPFPKLSRLPGHYVRASIVYSREIFEKYKARIAPDIIYAQGLTGYAFIAQKKIGAKLPPILINVHGYEFHQKVPSLKEKFEQFLLRPPFRYINKNADYICSFGGIISKLILTNYKVDSERIIEHPLGISTNFVRTTPIVKSRSRRFVFVGRYERRKGIEELTKVLSHIDPPKDFHFSFVGAIPEESRICASNIVYHGEIKDWVRIKMILENADILVCPSYAEGMPNVILEAMASGCAIIATDVGAVSRMVDFNNGWLIKPGCINQLHRAFLSAFEVSDERLFQMKTESVSRINREFLWDHIIIDLIRSFQKVIKAESRVND